MKSIDLKPGLRGRSLGIGALALILCMLFVGVRAFAMLGPTSARGLFLLMCVAMIALPWVLLSPHGRYQMGLKAPRAAGYLAIGLGIGIAAAALCFVIGFLLFGSSADNWFVSVARSYQGQSTAGYSILQLHLTFTIVACLFSPIGEELFFRGFLQKVLEQRLSVRASTHVEAGLFALVHLCHHGIVATAAGLVLLPASGALWVLLMFILAWCFAWLRRASDSVWSAVVGHAAFNATMNSFIFAFLWVHEK
ncbi:MAG: type II CAAX endopeptidase family protein [Pseudomonadota bacterium]